MFSRTREGESLMVGYVLNGMVVIHGALGIGTDFYSASDRPDLPDQARVTFDAAFGQFGQQKATNIVWDGQTYDVPLEQRMRN